MAEKLGNGDWLAGLGYHGENGRCIKVPHDGGGYLHSETDDGPYDVDGVWYCGRCHEYLPAAGGMA